MVKTVLLPKCEKYTAGNQQEREQTPDYFAHFSGNNLGGWMLDKEVRYTINEVVHQNSQTNKRGAARPDQINHPRLDQVCRPNNEQATEWVAPGSAQY